MSDDPDYSLLTIVWDTFRAPRWVHHLVKLLTGVLVLAAYYAGMDALLSPIISARLAIAAALCSLGWFLTLRVAYWLEHRTDQHEPAQLISADFVCDGALHCFAAALLLGNVFGGAMIAAPTLLFLAYVITYPHASS